MVKKLTDEDDADEILIGECERIVARAGPTRLHTANTKTLKRLAARLRSEVEARRELSALVSSLPVTADGEPIFPGKTVHFRCERVTQSGTVAEVTSHGARVAWGDGSLAEMFHPDRLYGSLDKLNAALSRRVVLA